MDEEIGFLVIPILIALAVLVCAVMVMVVFGLTALCAAGVWVVGRRSGRPKRFGDESGPEDLW